MGPLAPPMTLMEANVDHRTDSVQTCYVDAPDAQRTTEFDTPGIEKI